MMTRYSIASLRGVAFLAIASCCLPQAYFPQVHAEVTGATMIVNAGMLTGAARAPGDDGRLYLLGRSGQIKILDLPTGEIAAEPYLSIPGVSQEGEGGLLGLAFHPDYVANGKLYVYFTTEGGAYDQGVSHFVEYTRTPSNADSADIDSARPILHFDQPQTNHNGGWIGFSPKDGFLYLAIGDGGASNDKSDGHTLETGNSQDITENWLGKLLRIDINGDDFSEDTERNYAIPATNPFVDTEGDDEIWAYGLRNPFRCSFDRQTGDIWIGDVGQNTREEIDFQPDGVAGVNYGWRFREGEINTPTGGVGRPKPEGAVDPVYDYEQKAGPFDGKSVTGGYVYRGPDPDVQGSYFFADYVSNNYWRFDPSDPDGSVSNINSELFGEGSPPAGAPVGFAEDSVGNLYLITLYGDVYRIETDTLAEGDAAQNTDALGTAGGVGVGTLFALAALVLVAVLVSLKIFLRSQ